MWIATLVLIGGFIALVWSADRFLSGAASTAAHVGMSKMLIGLTVVAVGTSAPEILVSVAASLEGDPLLAVGNAIGSNIANIGLVLGITAMIAPLPFSRAVLKTELPWLLLATTLALVLLIDLRLTTIDGILLLTGLSLILFRLYQNQTRATGEPIAEGFEEELDELADMSLANALLWLLLGLIVLIASANALVWAASDIAARLGVSELIIGLTIVAVGTSLPELAATIGSALKGHPEIAIGNVVGSNILNILAVLSVPGLLSGVTVSPAAFWRDGAMMLALTMLLALFAYGINSRRVITRFEGAVLTLAWIAYNAMLVHQAQS